MKIILFEIYFDGKGRYRKRVKVCRQCIINVLRKSLRSSNQYKIYMKKKLNKNIFNCQGGSKGRLSKD